MPVSCKTLTRLENVPLRVQKMHTSSRFPVVQEEWQLLRLLDEHPAHDGHLAVVLDREGGPEHQLAVCGDREKLLLDPVVTN